MRHKVHGNRLNRDAAHRRAMLRNMVTSLLENERITTTLPKAKEARRFAERMITFAKRGDLHSRRMAARFVNRPAVLQKLFAEIGPRFESRPGGYTRILRLGRRRGDDAQQAIIELVEPEFKARPRREKTAPQARLAASETAAEAVEEVAEEAEIDEATDAEVEAASEPEGEEVVEEAEGTQEAVEASEDDSEKEKG